MRRLFVLVTALSLVAAVPAAEQPGWTTVGEEACIAGPDTEQLTSPDWEDLCSVAWRTVASGDVPTTVEVRLRVVGNVGDRMGPVYYTTAWEAGDCQFALVHRDETAVGEGLDLLRVRCGDVTVNCDVVQVGPDGLLTCRDDADSMIDVPVTPVIDGTDITWRVTFDGELADVAHLHARGAEIVPTLTIAGDQPVVSGAHVSPVDGPDTTVTVEPSAYLVCVLGVCPGPFDDGLRADRTYTIG